MGVKRPGDRIRARIPPEYDTVIGYEMREVDEHGASVLGGYEGPSP
jgi:hypothetical protein